MSDFKISELSKLQNAGNNMNISAAAKNEDIEIGVLLSGNKCENSVKTDFSKEDEKVTPRIIFVSREQKEKGKKLGYDYSLNYIIGANQSLSYICDKLKAILNDINKENAYYFFSEIHCDFAVNFVTNYNELDGLRYDDIKKPLDLLKEEAELMGLAGTDEYYNFVKSLKDAVKNVNNNTKNPYSGIKAGNIDMNTAKKIDETTYCLVKIMGKYITNDESALNKTIFYDNPDEIYDLPKRNEPHTVTISKSDKKEGEDAAKYVNSLFKKHQKQLRDAAFEKRDKNEKRTEYPDIKDNIKYLKHVLSGINEKSALSFFETQSADTYFNYVSNMVSELRDFDNVLTYADIEMPVRALLKQAKSMGLEREKAFYKLLESMANADKYSKTTNVSEGVKYGDISIKEADTLDRAIKDLVVLMKNYINVE